MMRCLPVAVAHHVGRDHEYIWPSQLLAHHGFNCSILCSKIISDQKGCRGTFFDLEKVCAPIIFQEAHSRAAAGVVA